MEKVRNDVVNSPGVPPGSCYLENECTNKASLKDDSTPVVKFRTVKPRSLGTAEQH